MKKAKAYMETDVYDVAVDAFNLKDGEMLSYKIENLTDKVKTEKPKSEKELIDQRLVVLKERKIRLEK